MHQFFSSMVVGVKALMYSAEFIDLEEEESESMFEKWLDNKFRDKVKDIVIYFSLALSLVFSVGLFIVLPNLATSGIDKLCSMSFMPDALTRIADTKTFYNIVEAIIKMGIFMTYMALV